MLEHGEGQPSKEEIVSAIRRQLESGGLLSGQEINEQVEAIDWAKREELERQRAFYQNKITATVENLSSEPKGPANRDMERSGSRRLGYCENMIDLLNQLIEMTPEVSEEQA